MSEPVPSKRLRAGDSSLATVASLTTEENLYDVDIPDEPFWAHFHKFQSVYANGRAVKQLSQPIGHPQHTWLDIVDQYILENESDDDNGVPQSVDGVFGTESDDEAL